MTPTARTLQYCKKQGWLAGVTEKWVAIKNHPAGGVRRDLFGCIDIIVLANGRCIGIQATSGSNGSARITKIRSECNEAARMWLACGNSLQVWGWRKLKVKRGGKAVRWQPSITEVTITTLQDTP